jgi:hypothetical protein
MLLMVVGTYKDFVPFVEEIKGACKEHPKAKS